MEYGWRGWTSPSGGACGGQRSRWRVSSPLCCIGSGLTGRSSSGARTRPWQPPHNAKEANSSERGRRGSAPTRFRRRDAEMVRQVPLQWPGAIPRLRPVDCSATPSYSMKWRFRADHGQKHETGDWMHSELDDQGPITEAAEPKLQFSHHRVARRASADFVSNLLDRCVIVSLGAWPGTQRGLDHRQQRRPGGSVAREDGHALRDRQDQPG